MARFSGKKPLEKKAIKKKALQTKNVKKLMTSDDAYSPEKRMIKVFKKTPTGGTGMVKMTTDFSNIKDEARKAKEKFAERVGTPTSVQVLGPEDRKRTKLKPALARLKVGGLAKRGVSKILRKK